MRFRVMLPAADIERAREWYQRVLGLEPAEIEENGDAWYEVDGRRIMVYGSSFAGTNQATAATIEVEDVEATVSELRSRGARFEEYDFGEDFRTSDGIYTANDGTKLAWLKDSEGNILGISPQRD